MIHRRALIGGSAAAGGLVLARPALAQSASSRVLRFVPQAAYSVPDPVWTTAIVVITHSLMVYDTLYGVDIDLAPQPQMCAGSTVSPDGLVWDFTLRDGLLFHDGTPVRGVDVAQSIRRWGQRDTFGQQLLALTAEITAPSDLTFRIRLTAPFPRMLYALGASSCFIMPERVAKTSAGEAIKDFTGSGPFKFLQNEWVAGVRAVYARFEGYKPRAAPPNFLAGGKIAHFDRVEWVTQPDPGTAASALRAGEIDWIDQPLFDLVPSLKKDPKVAVQQLDAFGLIGIIALNHLQPPFNNAKLRQALLPAVDQREFVAAVLGDQVEYARIPVGYFTAGSPMASDAGMAALTGKRDIALARKMVDASGYAGETAVIMDPADQPQMHAMAEVTLGIYQQLGIKSRIEATDWGTLLSRRAVTKPITDGGWSSFNTRQTGLGAADPTNAQLRGNGLKAWFGWPTDPALDEQRVAWFNAPDLAGQKRASEAMQLEAFRAVPYIPLGQWSQPTAYRSDLTGFVKGSNPVFWGVRRA
ncbi:ABC transporter substrate-binding protein [Acidisphaera sp. L21]|uniref:ABC transporter substrate-binding protein n=1 Tax=Acidisphaera sp. L21 TaxID=1641851 RepID=UPI00131D02C6|nr:ABC transporter substrate-binding protein [Acidisphaera sp. L21]